MLDRVERAIDTSPVGRLFDRLKTPLAADATDGIALSRPADRIVLALLALLGAAVTAAAMAAVPLTLHGPHGFDIWFQADQPRVMTVLRDAGSFWHLRDSVHPFFSILIYPVAAALRLVGVAPLLSVKLTVGACGVAAPPLMFAVLRRLGLPLPGAILGALMLVASATFLFWFPQVETYPFTGLSDLVALWLFLRWRDARGRVALLASLVTFSMTVTNWMLGLAVVAMRFRLGAVLRIAALTLVAAVLIAKAQAMIFPYAQPFYGRGAMTSEVAYTQPALATAGQARWTPLANWRSMLASAAVTPRPYLETLPTEKPAERLRIVDNQAWARSGYGALGWVAVGCWLGAMLLAAAGLVLDGRVDRMVAALLLFMVGQLLLHAVYGDLTFLFAADFFPVLLVLVALGGLTRFRRAHALLMAGCIVAGGVWNARMYETAMALARASVFDPAAKVTAGVPDPAG